MKHIPAAFKSATFLFFSAVLLGVMLLASIATLPLAEVWYSASLVVIALFAVGGMVACILADKSR